MWRCGWLGCEPRLLRASARQWMRQTARSRSVLTAQCVGLWETHQPVGRMLAKRLPLSRPQPEVCQVASVDTAQIVKRSEIIMGMCKIRLKSFCHTPEAGAAGARAEHICGAAKDHGRRGGASPNGAAQHGHGSCACCQHGNDPGHDHDWQQHDAAARSAPT